MPCQLGYGDSTSSNGVSLVTQTSRTSNKCKATHHVHPHMDFIWAQAEVNYDEKES